MSFACPICLDLIKEAPSANNVDNHVMATPCGHVFHRSCIFNCLDRNQRCPSCTKTCYHQSIIRLYPTGDEENEQAIRKLEIQLENRIIETQHKDDEIHEMLESIHEQYQLNASLKDMLENREKEYLKLHNDVKIMNIDARAKEATVISLRQGHEKLTAERDEKIKSLAKLQTELETLKRTCCTSEQFKQSKEKYRSLVTRFETLMDEKLEVVDKLEQIKKDHDTLVIANTNLKSQYETLSSENQPEASQGEKEKYNKLLDRFEKVADKKNAIVQEFELYKKNHQSTEDYLELQQRYRDLQFQLKDQAANYNQLKEENLELKKKAKELDRAYAALEKVSTELKGVKKEHTKAIETMKINNSKLYTQKEKIVSELKSLKKTRLENANAIINLGVGAAIDDSMDYNELQKKYLEVKAARNRLIRESNRNKQRADSVINDNTKLQEKIKRLETIIAEASSNSVIDKAKQKEITNHCDQLVALIKSL